MSGEVIGVLLLFAMFAIAGFAAGFNTGSSYERRRSQGTPW